MNTIRKMTAREGDLAVEFRPGVASEVELARDFFRTAQSEGYLAYRKGEGGQKNEQLFTFDPQAKETILALPLAGG